MAKFQINAKVLFQTGKTNRHSTMKGRRLEITWEWGKQRQRAQANLPVLICTLFLCTYIASIYTSRRERWVKKGLQDYNQVNWYMFIIRKTRMIIVSYKNIYRTTTEKLDDKYHARRIIYKLICIDSFGWVWM